MQAFNIFDACGAGDGNLLCGEEFAMNVPCIKIKITKERREFEPSVRHRDSSRGERLN